jgi:hypothetical protein
MTAVCRRTLWISFSLLLAGAMVATAMEEAGAAVDEPSDAKVSYEACSGTARGHSLLTLPSTSSN